MDTAEKRQLIEQASALFMRYGIRSVSMDDIARSLGISKKTLYQQVATKEELVGLMMEQRCADDVTAMFEIRKRATDAIDEMLNIARFVINQVRDVSNSTVYDLQKYYPQHWQKMERMHNDQLYEVIRTNLERGIEQGLYRVNIEAEIVTKIFTAISLLMGDAHYFPLQQYSLEQLIRQLMLYHIYGVASPKGLTLLHAHLGNDSANI